MKGSILLPSFRLFGSGVILGVLASSLSLEGVHPNEHAGRVSRSPMERTQAARWPGILRAYFCSVIHRSATANQERKGRPRSLKCILTLVQWPRLRHQACKRPQSYVLLLRPGSKNYQCSTTQPCRYTPSQGHSALCTLHYTET